MPHPGALPVAKVVAVAHAQLALHRQRREPKELVPFPCLLRKVLTSSPYSVVQEYFSGSSYSIADMAIYGWAWRHERHQVDLADFPNVKRWFEAVGARPAVQKALADNVAKL